MSFWVFPQGFKTRGRFSHPYKWWFVLLPNQRGTSQSTLLRAPASSLALFPSSNRCGTAPKTTSFWGPASLLAHPTLLRAPASSLALFPSSNRCGTALKTKTTPFWGQCSYWTLVYPLSGKVRRLTHCLMSGFDTISNGSDPPLADIVFFGLFLSGFPSRL